MTSPELVVGTRKHAKLITAKMTPVIRDALQWLTFSHLPEALQKYSRPFYVAAVEIIQINAYSPELKAALDKLIEAKDCAVRAGIRTDTGRAGSVPRPSVVVSPPVLSGQLPNHPVFGQVKREIRPDQIIPTSEERPLVEGP